MNDQVQRFSYKLAPPHPQAVAAAAFFPFLLLSVLVLTLYGSLPEIVAKGVLIALALLGAALVKICQTARDARMTVDARGRLHIQRRKLGLVAVRESHDLRSVQIGLGHYQGQPGGAVIHLTTDRGVLSVGARQAGVHPGWLSAQQTSSVVGWLEGEGDFQRFMSTVQASGARLGTEASVARARTAVWGRTAIWYLVPLALSAVGILAALLFPPTP